jgi:succinyl-diaminopimelate desuccinylase
MSKSLEMRKKIDDWIDTVRQEYIDDVIGAVSIPSIAVCSQGKYPFGEACARMLDYMEDCVKKYGFNYTNHEYYCGTSLIKGTNGKGEIGMFGHTDVVEAGEGWTVEPFCGQEKDGYIVGRGSNDNKGSTFACIYAMRFFKENNIHLKNNIRLLYGCNEEAGMEDIKYYGKKYGFPTLTIVPDSWFPISRSEKGVINLTVDAPVNSGNLLQFQAGTNGITIPNKAVCFISGYTLEQVQKAAKAYPNIHPSAHKNGVLITATGIAKHAAFPEGSVNAISVMASFLLAEGLVSGDAKMVLEFIAESLSDYEGKALNIDFHDDLAGKTSHTIAMIELINQKMEIHFNVRYPASPSIDGDMFYEKFMSYFDKPFLTKVSSKHCRPHAVDINHPVVNIFCDVSSEILGQPLKPFAQAGGTYTCVTPNSFAAGAAVHGWEQQLFKQEGHGGAHQPDECMEIEVLLNGIRIYILALLAIDEWLDNQMP